MGNRFKTELSKLREGLNAGKKNKKSRLAFPELEHELTVYEIELKMQNLALANTLQQLTSSYQEYEVLFEKSPVGYFVLNSEGIIQKVNEMGCTQLGIDRLLAIDRPFSAFLKTESDQDNFYLFLNRAIALDNPGQFVCTITKMNNSVFSARIKMSITQDEEDKFKHLLLMVSEYF